MDPEQQATPPSVGAAPGGAAGHHSGKWNVAKSFKREDCMQKRGRIGQASSEPVL